jgi:hypothetical protein
MITPAMWIWMHYKEKLLLHSHALGETGQGEAIFGSDYPVDDTELSFWLSRYGSWN